MKLVASRTGTGRFVNRRPPSEGYLCTYEAVVSALQVIEPDTFTAAKVAKLNAPLDLQIALWTRHVNSR